MQELINYFNVTFITLVIAGRVVKALHLAITLQGGSKKEEISG